MTQTGKVWLELIW